MQPNYMERKSQEEEGEKRHLPSPGSTHQEEEFDQTPTLTSWEVLASQVDTIVWATVDSGAATSCLPKELAQSIGVGYDTCG